MGHPQGGAAVLHVYEDRARRLVQREKGVYKVRVGTISYATSRGLGHLARDFHRHGVITDVFVMEHPSVPSNREEWYPNALHTTLRGMDTRAMLDFCQGMDAVLFFETPFHWDLFRLLRGKVRTFLATMYECTPRFHQRPDVYLCPSRLDLDYFWDTSLTNVSEVDRGLKSGEQAEFPQTWRVYRGLDNSRAVWVQLPVEYPWQLRTHALHYVHNGGYLGVKTRQGGVMREGTTTLIEAMCYVRSPVRLTIRVQENVSPRHQKMCAADPRVEYLPETVPYGDLYQLGDVAVGSQRWNGCSLPLQEAFAAGMLVMNTDRYPAHTWLPNPPLIPVRNWLKDSSIGGSYLSFDEADVHPEDVAAKIDEFYGKDIQDYSRRGMDWAAKNSWKVLGSKWLEVLKL